MIVCIQFIAKSRGWTYEKVSVMYTSSKDKLGR